MQRDPSARRLDMRLRTSEVQDPESPGNVPGQPDSAYSDCLEAQLGETQRDLVAVSSWATTLRQDLEAQANELVRLKATLSWRLTQPFRRVSRAWRSRSAVLAWAPMMRVRRAMRALPLPRRAAAFVKGVVLHRLFGVIPRRAARGVIKVDSGSANRRWPESPNPTTAPNSRLPDIFVWAGREWPSCRPRARHLIRGLASGGRRVFYVCPQFVVRSAPGFDAEPLDGAKRLFTVRLHAAGGQDIRSRAAAGAARTQILRSIGRVLEWTSGVGTVNLVQDPFWLPFAEMMPSNVLVHDCMDGLPDWERHSPELIAFEHVLLQRADFLMTSSAWHEHFVSLINPSVALVRNAADYEHFAVPPHDVYRHPDAFQRPVVGYFGELARWFDADLVRAVATGIPDALVLLAGEDAVGAGSQLADLENVHLVGDVAYAELPHYLHACDVCILPISMAPSAAAASPASVYDFLSAGKLVVATDHPEIRHFGDLVRRTGSAERFVSAVREGLAKPADEKLTERRRQYASEHTWNARADALREHIHDIALPSVSVIVVTRNHLDLTTQCLESIEAMTAYGNYEVIVVDNGSSDGTPAFLDRWAGGRADRRVILNPDNRGFAAASNQGLAAADGKYLALLNNDTAVTAGWLGTLVGHLRRDHRIGLIGPVTNNAWNDARIDIEYTDLDQLHAVARRWTSRHLGQTRSIPSLTFFCVATSREVYDDVGPLDEAFGIGMFEDHDYCRRVERTGRRLACALDVFVHHESGASFDAMDQEHRWELFERNKRLYEARWGPGQLERMGSDLPSDKAHARFVPRR